MAEVVLCACVVPGEAIEASEGGGCSGGHRLVDRFAPAGGQVGGPAEAQVPFAHHVGVVAQAEENIEDEIVEVRSSRHGPGASLLNEGGVSLQCVLDPCTSHSSCQ